MTLLRNHALMREMTKRTPIQEVFDYFGGVTGTAEALDLTKQAVSIWEKNSIPAERAIELEIMTRGRFKATLLRPDIRERVMERYRRRQQGLQ